ncbi:FAD-dependent oxidoreductase [Petrimonas mucosa]|jgi:NADPH-dependent 2,4-dienoyl-CoA reductase/sulfur reductase-like enzyme/rhodanese-related sulfurtransferase|uniref:FAD-dependent oxidoreductase n=1 Tax=Petrimonas mucosa TaxID=1642646 RepID=UPI0017588E74|nr:FAD-dependent oxidoreductase [Petrimonas mucosa]HHT29567.1 FAD-dependent oxidoreductase [Petrimonas mucosa]
MGAKRIIVIGGSAAGPKAASKARRMDENAEITIFQKASDLSMASCGYPYYVGGFFDDRSQLLCSPAGVVRDAKFFWNAKKINTKVLTEVTRIDRKQKKVEFTDLTTGKTGRAAYDKLVIATGSNARKPPVPGVELEGITTLQSLSDADYLRKIKDEGVIKKAVVIGGGLIGIETLEALHLAGIHITLIELLPQMLTFLDKHMARLVEKYVQTKVNVILQNGVASFLGENGVLKAVKLQDGTEIPCDLAVVAIGVTPNNKLAKEAGLAIGETGGILVDEYMQTTDPDIYAIGDCVEIPHLITHKPVHAPFGDLANLQGRVAGENLISGNVVKFPGTIQTGICKLFDYGVGSTGLSEQNALKLGYTDIETVVNASLDKPGFMNGNLLITKLIADKRSGKILGAQVIGAGDVSKQVAIWAMAIKGQFRVDDMVNADLPYAPPFSLAIDHSIATAHIMQNKLKGLFKDISAEQLKDKLKNKEPMLLLDVRNPNEFEEVRLGIGERLIPLGQLRNRLGEMPEDKTREIIAWCKISLRGYEAALILQANGYTNVKVLEGGIAAWPWSREK